MAKQYGLKKLAVPSAGNAASALAAYCAAAGIEAHIFMPKDVPLANLVECKSYGAHVTLVDGLISDCARMVNERKQAEGWFDISTLKEPFRVEGKKTMGYEVAEQLNWELPDAIFYPTGGGVGLIGMWKAFDEMEQLGWLKSGKKRPKMIVVQDSGCAPVVKAWNEHKPVAEMWQGAQTSAAGLHHDWRAPVAIEVLTASTTHQALAILGSNDETGLLDAGQNNDAVCLVQHVDREAIFGVCEFLKHLTRSGDSLTGFLGSREKGRRA